MNVSILDVASTGWSVPDTSPSCHSSRPPQCSEITHGVKIGQIPQHDIASIDAILLTKRVDAGHDILDGSSPGRVFGWAPRWHTTCIYVAIACVGFPMWQGVAHFSSLAQLMKACCFFEGCWWRTPPVAGKGIYDALNVATASPSATLALRNRSGVFRPNALYRSEAGRHR